MARGGAVILDDVVAVGDDCARGRPHETADHADERGLAGAVGAEQREDLAAPDREIHAFQRLVPAVVGLVQAGNYNDGIHTTSLFGRTRFGVQPALQHVFLRALAARFGTRFQHDLHARLQHDHARLASRGHPVTAATYGATRNNPDVRERKKARVRWRHAPGASHRRATALNDDVTRQSRSD